jgi:phosphoglycolate phosphatase
MDFDLLVFDLDGTLIDSKEDIIQAVNWTLAQQGVPILARDLIASHVGTGVRPLMEEALTSGGVTPTQKALEQFNAYYRDHLTVKTRLYGGIEEVLEHYRKVKKVVLTNKSNQFALPILRELKIDGLFVGTYGRESFVTCKPDPGPLLNICREFNVALERTVMIGDTTVDMRAGSSAGTKTCAVLYGFGGSESLLAEKPTFIASKPIDLIGLFSTGRK